MEDITAVKLRAKTPPWQRIEQSQWWVAGLHKPCTLVTALNVIFKTFELYPRGQPPCSS
jgi:hypothetical protein